MTPVKQVYQLIFLAGENIVTQSELDSLFFFTVEKKKRNHCPNDYKFYDTNQRKYKCLLRKERQKVIQIQPRDWKLKRSQHKKNLALCRLGRNENTMHHTGTTNCWAWSIYLLHLENGSFSGLRETDCSRQRDIGIYQVSSFKCLLMPFGYVFRYTKKFSKEGPYIEK